MIRFRALNSCRWSSWMPVARKIWTEPPTGPNWRHPNRIYKQSSQFRNVSCQLLLDSLWTCKQRNRSLCAFCCNSLAKSFSFWCSQVFPISKLNRSNAIRVIIGDHLCLCFTNRSNFWFLETAKMFRRLVLVTLLIYFVHQASGEGQCSRLDPVTKSLVSLDCSKFAPDCCLHRTPDAYCCYER